MFHFSFWQFLLLYAAFYNVFSPAVCAKSNFDLWSDLGYLWSEKRVFLDNTLTGRFLDTKTPPNPTFSLKLFSRKSIEMYEKYLKYKTYSFNSIRFIRNKIDIVSNHLKNGIRFTIKAPGSLCLSLSHFYCSDYFPLL